MRTLQELNLCDDLGEKFMTFEEKLQEVAYQERSVGKQEAKLAIAKKMKDKGLELEIIVETTGLTFEEIKNL